MLYHFQGKPRMNVTQLQDSPEALWFYHRVASNSWRSEISLPGFHQKWCNAVLPMAPPHDHAPQTSCCWLATLIYSLPSSMDENVEDHCLNLADNWMFPMFSINSIWKCCTRWVCHCHVLCNTSFDLHLPIMEPISCLVVWINSLPPLRCTHTILLPCLHSCSIPLFLFSRKETLAPPCVTLWSMFTYFLKSCLAEVVLPFTTQLWICVRTSASVSPGSWIFDRESTLLLHVDMWFSCHLPGEQ